MFVNCLVNWLAFSAKVDGFPYRLLVLFCRRMVFFLSVGIILKVIDVYTNC